MKNAIKRILIKLFFKKNLVLLESTPDFSDNTYPLYLELAKNKKLHLIWCIHFSCLKKNVKSVLLKSFKYKFLRLIAGYTFYSHTFLGDICNTKQIRVFLTHGMSFKDTRGLMGDSSIHSYIISLSEFHSILRTKTIPGCGNKLLELGYPRNDMLFAKKEIIRDKKLVLWLPTFRHMKDANNITRSDYGDKSSTEFNLIDFECLKMLDEYLIGKNIEIYIKFHPNQDLRYVKILQKAKFNNITIFTSKDFIDKKYNLYNLLANSDALISDFSSVYIDYLLTEKPIAFDISDFDNYKEGIGFIVNNPLEYMPGMKIRKFDDLKEFLESVGNNDDLFYQERCNLKNLCHKYKDGKAARRIVDYFGLEGNDEKI